jgi:hypothetical protein
MSATIFVERNFQPLQGIKEISHRISFESISDYNANQIRPFCKNIISNDAFSASALETVSINLSRNALLLEYPLPHKGKSKSSLAETLRVLVCA